MRLKPQKKRPDYQSTAKVIINIHTCKKMFTDLRPVALSMCVAYRGKICCRKCSEN